MISSYYLLQTLVLSDFDYLHTKSIQNQLGAQDLKYDITSSQLVCISSKMRLIASRNFMKFIMLNSDTFFLRQLFTPVPRPQGWLMVFWDMVRWLMTVIDPLYSKKCPHPPTQQQDEIIAWKLHYALFHCLNEYYAGWPTSKDGWTLKFMAATDTLVTRYFNCVFLCH